MWWKRLNEGISLFRQWKDVSRKSGKENGMVDLLHMAMKLVNGELQIAEDEAEIIRLVYEKFIE